MTIPKSMRTIGYFAFYRCSSLTSITFPKGITTIGRGAFCECSGLKKVTLPKGLKTIDDEAFYDCSALKNVTFPDSITRIDSEAFEGTAWLKAQRKKNPLVVVNHILIDGRTAKGNVTIPKGVKTVSGSVFYNCTRLKSVTIPSSVTKISEYAFLGCSDKLVIYGKKDSVAERYAKKKGYSFVVK